jgi:hypothetical protein
MKNLIKYWVQLVLLFGAIIIFGWVIPDQYLQMKIKDSAMRNISSNGLIFKGDTITVSNISTVVLLPEDRDSLKVMFNRADKLSEYIYKNRYRIGEFEKVLGTLRKGSIVVRYRYSMFDMVTLIFEDSSRFVFWGSISIIYNEDADKFIYILTKYKKYQDEAYKAEKKEIAKTNKIKDKLKSI